MEMVFSWGVPGPDASWSRQWCERLMLRHRGDLAEGWVDSSANQTALCHSGVWQG